MAFDYISVARADILCSLDNGIAAQGRLNCVRESKV